MADRVDVLRIRTEESGSDKVAAALEKVAAGATAADKAVAKYIADAATKMQPVAEALAKSQDDFAKATLSTARSIQNLQNRIDPAARALSDYERAQRKVNLAIESGQISSEKGAAILAGYEQRYIKASTSAGKFANDNEKAFALNRAGMQELQASGINAFQALAAGMSVTQVATMEGAQVIGAFIQGTEGGFKGLVSAVKSGAASVASFAIGLGPWGIALAGVTVGVAALAYEFRKDIPDMDKTLKDQEGILGKIEERYEGIREKIQSLPTATGAGLGIDVGKNARDLQTLIAQQAHSTSADFTSYWGQLIQGAFDSANPATRSTFAPIMKQVDAFRQSLKTSEPDVLGFRRELSDLYNSAGATDKMKKAIEVAYEYTKPLAALEDALNADREALKNMGKAAEDEYEAMKQHASSTYLTDMQRQVANDHLAIREIAARTVAEKAEIAVERTRLNNAGKSMKPELDAEQQASASKLIYAQAKRQADDALRDANRSLGEAGLDGYAASMKQINDQLRQQIELNPRNAATWQMVAAAQKKALDIQTNKALIEPIEEQIRATQAQADAIGKSDDAQRRILATLQAEEALRQKGIDLNSRYAASYEKIALVASDYSAAVAKQKAAWDSIHSAESGAIDDLINGITSGGKWQDTLKTLQNDILKEATTLGVANPIKNAPVGGVTTLRRLFA